MNLTLRPAVLTAVLLATALGLAGCGKSYVNPNIADPSQTKERLARDKELCKAEANSDVPPTFGMERFEYDPTIEAQATRWVANVAEDDANQDAFTKCMRMRGWRYR